LVWKKRGSQRREFENALPPENKSISHTGQYLRKERGEQMGGGKKKTVGDARGMKVLEVKKASTSFHSLTLQQFGKKGKSIGEHSVPEGGKDIFKGHKGRGEPRLGK